jgi:hypothetical protein
MMGTTSLRHWVDQMQMRMRSRGKAGAGAPLTRESVVRAFVQVLGRLPESEEVIEAHRALGSWPTLLSVLEGSAEYARRVPTRHGIGAHRSAVDAPSVAAGSVYGREPKIVIVGNCQAHPLARLMQAMGGFGMPTVIQTTSALLEGVRRGKVGPLAPVAGSDLVFVQGVQDLADRIGEMYPSHASRMRLVPAIAFSGFHPDMVYLFDRASGRALRGVISEYHSAIAVAACLQGLSVEDTMALFRADVFGELGYYDHWSLSREALAQAFSWAGLELGDAFRQWTAAGCWMYSINHPKPRVLADVARQLLRRDGFTVQDGAEEFVPDSLAHDAVWPVYPDIARVLGVAGSYRFKRPLDPSLPRHPVVTIGLEELVTGTFAYLQGKRLQDFSCDRLLAPRFRDLRRFLATSAPQVPAPAAGARTSPTDLEAGTGNPYHGLPDYQFWRRAVAGVAPAELDPVLHTRFRLGRNDRVATAGSCFAQHISNTLRNQGFQFLVTESAPALPEQEAARRQFGLFSARYGNLYTARQLLQLFERAHGMRQPLDTGWQRSDGRWVDPLRPQVEPDGYASAREVLEANELHLDAVRRMFSSLDVLVFTLGLTEAWRSKVDGTVYPLAPGVAAGRLDSTRHEFVNFSVDEVAEDLRSLVQHLRRLNAGARVILTVSPVPLIATFESRHVLVSNTESKAVLRVAAARLVAQLPAVDYFPSYEIVTGAASRMQYFADDLRSVTQGGVDHVMRLFLRHYANEQLQARDEFSREAARVGEVMCDEEALDRRA